MATLTLRVDDETREELELLAQGRGTNVSVLLRSAIDDLLGRTSVATSTSAPKSLSMLDRQMLTLQHEILKRLGADADEVEYHEMRIEVLRQGFTTEYQREFAGIGDELSPAECALIMEILDMFSVLEDALDRLGDQAPTVLGERASHTLRFRGFDHESPQEVRLANLAKYLSDDGRWSTLAYHFDDEHDGGNSNAPFLEWYRRLLQAYRAVVADRQARAGRSGFGTYRFEIADLQKILDAARRPRARATYPEIGSADTKGDSTVAEPTS